ncbi:hypothetical protein EMIT0373P_60205 [Pseudomonas chlororaphis]
MHAFLNHRGEVAEEHWHFWSKSTLTFVIF